MSIFCNRQHHQNSSGLKVSEKWGLAATNVRRLAADDAVGRQSSKTVFNSIEAQMAVCQPKKMLPCRLQSDKVVCLSKPCSLELVIKGEKMAAEAETPLHIIKEIDRWGRPSKTIEEFVAVAKLISPEATDGKK